MQEAHFRIAILFYVRDTYGTQTLAANAWGVSPAYVSGIIRGKKKVPGFLLEEMGFERVELVEYQKKK